MLELFIVSLIFAHLNLGVVLMNRKHSPVSAPIAHTLTYQEYQAEQPQLKQRPIQLPRPVLPRFFLQILAPLAALLTAATRPPLPARAPPSLV
jgi:hypothetical protein